jgi:hypothetical protein
MPTESGTWTYWQGHWGATESSPGSPGQQPMFASPWERCADDNEWCPMPEEASARQALSDGGRTVSGQMIEGPYAERCEGWFGGDVPALLCAPDALDAAVEHSRLGAAGSGQLVITREGGKGRYRELAARLDHTASAPGLTQTVGAPLRPGDLVRIVAPSQQDWSLFLRLIVDDRLVEARFGDVPSGRFRVGISDGAPVLQAPGRDLSPAQIRARPSGE